MITRFHVRTPVVTAIGVLAGGLSLGTAMAVPTSDPATVSAEPRPATITIVRHPDLAPGLAEVRVDASVDAAGGVGRVLDVSSDERRAAIAGRLGPEETTLSVGGPDGVEQVRLPGLVSAAFSTDGSWLAAIDGQGSLWRVTGGVATRLPVAGPFAGEPLVESDGSIVALRVSSVEAPIAATPVRVAADGRTATSLSKERLVYGISRLDDGSLVFATHRPTGNVMLRQDGDGPLADLGPDAVHASVSASGDTIAFERYGQIFVQRAGGPAAKPIGTGSRPRIAADGQTVLVELPVGSALLTVDGRSLAVFASQARFAGCDEGC